MNKKEIIFLLQKTFLEKGSTITLQEVASKAGCCVKTFRKWMKQEDVYDNCPDVFRNILKTIHSFDNINEESAYWLGYLMADGCFTNNSSRNGSRLMLECKTEDREILEKFCQFLNIRKDRITSGHNGTSVALSLADSNFSTSVNKYGIVKNKSHTENHVPEEILKNDLYFLQYLKGIIDGDGTIHAYKGSPGISFVTNSKSFAEECKEKLEKLLPEPTSIWIVEKTKEQIPKATQSLYTLKIGTGRYNHSNMNYLYDKFYNNQKIILTRKQQLFKTILGSL